MDSEIKWQWVNALRSGKYKQGRHSLKKTTILRRGLSIFGRKVARKEEHSYCCLGVLCEILNVEGKPSNPQNLDSYYWWYGDGEGNESAAFPTSEVQKYAGLEYSDMNRLSKLNDRGHSFSYIADFIEENL